MIRAAPLLFLFSFSASADEIFISSARVFGHPDADAILIKENRIDSIGRAGALEKRVSPEARRLNAGGGWILPGLHDSHSHLMSGSRMLSQLRLTDKMGVEDIEKAVAAYARENPDKPWIEGRGWSYEISTNAYPSRLILDRAVPERPVVLESYDGHAYWANTRALEAAGILKASPDPRDGKIIREADGETPAGVLLDGAMLVLDKAIPPLSRDEKKSMLERACRHYLDLGFSSVLNISTDEEELDILEELRQSGRLPIRVTMALPLEGDLKRYRKLAKKYDHPFLRFKFLKHFTDGVIESKTAFMLEPYENSGELGKPGVPPERLKTMVLEANQAGFSVMLHSIGDAAVRLSLDAFEESAKKNRLRGIRNRVEHIELIHPKDLSRFGTLGVAASMQPYHANPFGPEPDSGVWSKNLGPSRLPRTFAWKDLLSHGAILAFGSDWPVMSANPLWGMAVAMTRKDENGEPKDGWNAHQAVRFEQAVRGYTEGASYASGRDHELGKIEPGYLADLTVLSPDADFSNPVSLWKARAVHVIVDGRLD